MIVGFSRGAYTARALAGLIVSQGLLVKRLTTDREAAYRAGAKAWYRYRRQASEKAGLFQRLVEALADLPAFVSRNELKDTDLIKVDSIAAVGVWDTVGALGLPHYIREPGVDAFKFADRKLSPKVERGFHAVALDEQRLDFIPCLWESGANVVQFAFPGAHADVGGSYTIKDRESGLSDMALKWMMEQMAEVGVRFVNPVFPQFAPDACAAAHKPWLKWPFNDPKRIAPRTFPPGVLQGHSSIDERKGQAVCHEPKEDPSIYTPSNWI